MFGKKTRELEKRIQELEGKMYLTTSKPNYFISNKGTIKTDTIYEKSFSFTQGKDIRALKEIIKIPNTWAIIAILEHLKLKLVFKQGVQDSYSLTKVGKK